MNLYRVLYYIDTYTKFGGTNKIETIYISSNSKREAVQKLMDNFIDKNVYEFWFNIEKYQKIL